MKEKESSRRGFLGSAASGAAFLAVARHVVGGEPRKLAPSDKLNVAGVGVGGMGGANINALASENIVALCDVHLKHAAGTLGRYPNAKTYGDYRKMLDAQKEIDAVVVGTPDHTHAVVSMAAIKAGKHVYTQKPLTHDVYESRALAIAAREAKVTTVMGIQGHSGEGARLICEWIWDGAIGEVREVDAWCSLSYYPWGHAGWSSRWASRPTEAMPVPEGLDWDLWIGPAPMRPFHRAYHPSTWRAWWDFGCGMMGDRGAHTLDPVYRALKLTAPTSVDASSTGLNPDTHPVASIVTYQFPARDKFPPLKLTWYDGLRAPRPEELEQGRVMGNPEGGALFKGTKGKLMAGVYGESPRLIPESLMKDYKRPEKQTIPRVTVSHEQDWARHAKAGTQPSASFDYSGPLIEMCLLGNVARKLDTRIEWDAANLKVTNNPNAEKLIRTPYREGWSL
ncbi:MAG: Gfo/Idh/MocA family oxidoreductase [Planctomycetes bacterium]|nr:Gfo/Idh/MocA family oxidoreductase [Planctomycetota bacterium]